MKLLKRIFQRRPKIIKLDKYNLIEAFELKGVKYYQFDDVYNMPTGRGMAALTIYAEFDMRCTKEYLLTHISAVDKILNPDKNKGIDLVALSIIHNNLKERLQLMPFPDYIYKLASILFFDETESPFNYNWEYNQKKIKVWQTSGGTLDFFCTVPLKNLMPFSIPSGGSVQTYFQLHEKINQLHIQAMQEVILRN
jgi:hypothetical protein